MFHVFTDESSQTQHRYMVLGGVVTSSRNVEPIVEQFAQIRARHNLYGEVKWTKTCDAKLTAYKDYIDVLLLANKQNKLHFHSLIVDTHSINNRRYNQGDRDLGFAKFLYQLLMKFGRLYARDDQLYVFLDNKNTGWNLEEFRTILNAGIRKRWLIPSKPFAELQFIDSKRADIVQAVDLLIGAIASCKNQHALVAGARPAKATLVQHILLRTSLPNLSDDTRIYNRHFTIWNFRFLKN